MCSVRPVSIFFLSAAFLLRCWQRCFLFLHFSFSSSFRRHRVTFLSLFSARGMLFQIILRGERGHDDGAVAERVAAALITTTRYQERACAFFFSLSHFPPSSPRAKSQKHVTSQRVLIREARAFEVWRKLSYVYDDDDIR